MGFDPIAGTLDFHFPWRARRLQTVNASNPIIVGDLVFLSESYGPGSVLLRLGEAEFQVRAAVTREPDRAVTPFSLGPRVLASPAGLAAAGLLGPGSLARYRHRLALHDGSTPEGVLAEVADRFPDGGWRARTFRQAAPRVRHLLDRMTTQLTLIALFTL